MPNFTCVQKATGKIDVQKIIRNYYNEDTQDKFKLQITRMWTTLTREIALSRYI